MARVAHAKSAKEAEAQEHAAFFQSLFARRGYSESTPPLRHLLHPYTAPPFLATHSTTVIKDTVTALSPPALPTWFLNRRPTRMPPLSC